MFEKNKKIYITAGMKDIDQYFIHVMLHQIYTLKEKMEVDYLQIFAFGE